MSKSYRTASLSLLVACAFCNGAVTAATLEEAIDVPHLDAQGRDGYQEFLAAKKHRVFVIAPGGTWAWRGMEATTDLALASALQACMSQEQGRCVPYAIDDKIVFDFKNWPTLWRPYKTLAELNAVKTGRARGERFFDLAFKGPAGNTMKVSDLHGQVTVLHFWGTWCPPCRREMPEIQKLQQELGAKSGVQFVLLQVREDFATAKRWAQQQNLSLPLYDSGFKAKVQGSLTLGNGTSIQDRDLAQIFPTTYVLDRHGIVVFSHAGPIDGWSQYLPFLRDVAEKSGK